MSHVVKLYSLRYVNNKRMYVKNTLVIFLLYNTNFNRCNGASNNNLKFKTFYMKGCLNIFDEIY